MHACNQSQVRVANNKQAMRTPILPYFSASKNQGNGSRSCTEQPKNVYQRREQPDPDTCRISFAFDAGASGEDGTRAIRLDPVYLYIGPGGGPQGREVDIHNSKTLWLLQRQRDRKK
jgi:hypothetical protein